MRRTDDEWGMTRLYILHQATRNPASSREMKEKLERHGVLLSAGSVARMLRGMEKRGYLAPAVGSDGHAPKRYLATRRGQVAIYQTKDKLRALFASLSTVAGR